MGEETGDSVVICPKQITDKDFPVLKNTGWKKTSEPACPNCLGFAVGDEKRAWWPGAYPEKPRDYWPKVVDPEETLEAFTLALKTVQFEPCQDDKPEVGYDKIALYALKNGTIRHVAKQEHDGTWRSKLGLHVEDIEHKLEGLEGPCFGRVVAFFKRPQKNI